MDKIKGKLLILDFDGALNDSYIPISKTFKSFGFPFLSRTDFRRSGTFRKFSNNHILLDLKLFFLVISTKFSRVLFKKYLEEGCKHHGEEGTLNTEMLEFLVSLRAYPEVNVVILSRNFLSNDHFNELITKMGMCANFDFKSLYKIVSIPFLVPKQFAIRKLMKEVSTPSIDTYFYGDEINDWRAALKAHVPQSQIFIYAGEKSFDSKERMQEQKINPHQIFVRVEDAVERLKEEFDVAVG